MQQRRDKVARGVELGSGAVAGTVGATLGAAKLRDAYQEEHSERFALQAARAEHAAGGSSSSAGRFARALTHGKPGFKPLLVGTTAAATATGAAKYRKHREHKALAKSAFGVEHGPEINTKRLRTGALRVVGDVDASVRQVRNDVMPTSTQNVTRAVKRADTRVRAQLGKARYYDPDRNRKRRGQVAAAGLVAGAGYETHRAIGEGRKFTAERGKATAAAKGSADSFRAAAGHNAGIQAQLDSMKLPVGHPKNVGGSMRARVSELESMRFAEHKRIAEGTARHHAALTHRSAARGAFRATRAHGLAAGGLLAGAYGARRYAHRNDYR